jgi:hypothetical protein
MSGIALMSANWGFHIPIHCTLLLTEEGRKFCVCVRILGAGPEVGMTGTQIALAYVESDRQTVTQTNEEKPKNRTITIWPSEFLHKSHHLVHDSS